MSYLLVVLAGASVALQQVLNADLRSTLGSPLWAGLISYLGGLLVFLAVLVVSGGPWLNGSDVARTPWMSWTGGVFGAAFIGISAVMVPRLGAATTLALIVCGQMLATLVFDQVGLLSVPQHPVTLLRLVGAACIIAGVALVRA